MDGLKILLQSSAKSMDCVQWSIKQQELQQELSQLGLGMSELSLFIQYTALFSGSTWPSGSQFLSDDFS